MPPALGCQPCSSSGAWPAWSGFVVGEGVWSRLLQDVAEGKTVAGEGHGGRRGRGPFGTAGEGGVGAEQGPRLDLL